MRTSQPVGTTMMARTGWQSSAPMAVRQLSADDANSAGILDSSPFENRWTEIVPSSSVAPALNPAGSQRGNEVGRPGSTRRIDEQWQPNVDDLLNGESDFVPTSSQSSFEASANISRGPGCDVDASETHIAFPAIDLPELGFTSQHNPMNTFRPAADADNTTETRGDCQTGAEGEVDCSGDGVNLIHQIVVNRTDDMHWTFDASTGAWLPPWN